MWIRVPILPLTRVRIGGTRTTSVLTSQVSLMVPLNLMQHSLLTDPDIGVLSIMSDVNTALMRSILESPYPSNTTINSTYATGDAQSLDKQNFDKMIAAYDSCMDLEAISAAGAKPLQDILSAYASQSSSNGTT
jgi:hypothetical protein